MANRYLLRMERLWRDFPWLWCVSESWHASRKIPTIHRLTEEALLEVAPIKWWAYISYPHEVRVVHYTNEVMRTSVSYSVLQALNSEFNFNVTKIEYLASADKEWNIKIYKPSLRMTINDLCKKLIAQQ